MLYDPESNYVITVVGDVNDADYVTLRTTLNGAVTTKIVALFERVGMGGPANGWVNNWDTSERRQGPHPKDMHGLTDLEFQMLNELMPWFDEAPIHSLEGVTVEPITEPLWVWTGKRD